MRLAYCIHALNLSGGIERVLTTKANYLADVLGYEVHIITARQKGRKEFFKLSEKIVRHDLDANDRIFVFKCNAGIKFGEFHFSHEKFMMKYGSNIFGRIYAAFRTKRLEKAVRKLDRFVVLTQADKEDWLKVRPDVEQIYNPLSFVSEDVSPLTRKRCIAAGRLESQKNFKDLITAWKTVDGRHPDWALSIYGNGSQKDALQSQINDMGLQGKVVLEGSTDNVRKEMINSSCLILTSKYEGFGMVILEAMEAGLPVISYDCPKGPSELVTIGANGYLAKVGDTMTLAQGICSVISNEELRKRFGAESKRRAGDFTLEKTMKKWGNLFKDCKSKS